MAKECGCSSSAACFDCGGCVEHCDCNGGFVECTCVRIDVDLDDARDCRAHGPSSTTAREQRRKEANTEAEFYQRWIDAARDQI